MRKIKSGREDLFMGLIIHFIISSIIAVITTLLIPFGEYIIGFCVFVFCMYSLFQYDFELIPKDHIATIKTQDNQAQYNQGLGGYFWRRFGFLKINNIYDGTIDKHEKSVSGFITKDNKKVNCTFQIFTKITDPILLEKTLGYDNFEEELAAYRLNQYEQYVRSATLSEIETATHDDLKEQATNIVRHHKRCGIEVSTKIVDGKEVPEIEVFGVTSQSDKEREEVVKQGYKEEIEEIKRKNIFKRISKIYLTMLCPLGDETEYELLEKAKKLLGDVDEEIILAKAVKLAEAYVSKEDRKKLYAEAKYAQELHEGKRTASDVNYSGIGKGNILLGAGGR